MSYEKYYPGGWQSGESGGTPITPEALNHIENGIKKAYSDFAPAGFGLGATPTYVADANTCKSNGWFYIDENTANKPKHIDYAVLFVYRRNYMEYVQEVVDVTKGSRATRNCYNGETWSEWEWVNPPMIPGVEYRTTERHNGKVKYKKLISFGEFPQSTSKEVSTGIDANKYRIVGVHRHAKEIGNNADILHLASITHEYTVVYSGLYFIHVTTNGSQSVTAEYLFEYEEV